MLILTQTYKEEIYIIPSVENSETGLVWVEILGQNSNPSLNAAEAYPGPHACKNCRNFGLVPYLSD